MKKIFTVSLILVTFYTCGQANKNFIKDNYRRIETIPDAIQSDFQKASIKIHHVSKNASRITLPVLTK